MQYEIAKEFTVDCAHRVYNQKLDDMEEKCKYIHGHTYTIKIFLTSETLDNDMVLDFNRLNAIKSFLDKFLDHRLLVSVHDSDLLETLNMLLRTLGSCKAEGMSKTMTLISLNAYVLIRCLDEQHVLKLHHDNVLINSVTIVPCNTTSESLAQWLHNVCQKLLPNVTVSRVVVKETPKSQACYYANHFNR